MDKFLPLEKYLKDVAKLSEYETNIHLNGYRFFSGNQLDVFQYKHVDTRDNIKIELNESGSVKLISGEIQRPFVLEDKIPEEKDFVIEGYREIGKGQSKDFLIESFALIPDQSKSIQQEQVHNENRESIDYQQKINNFIEEQKRNAKSLSKHSSETNEVQREFHHVQLKVRDVQTGLAETIELKLSKELCKEMGIEVNQKFFENCHSLRELKSMEKMSPTELKEIAGRSNQPERTKPAAARDNEEVGVVDKQSSLSRRMINRDPEMTNFEPAEEKGWLKGVFESIGFKRASHEKESLHLIEQRDRSNNSPLISLTQIIKEKTEHMPGNMPLDHLNKLISSWKIVDNSARGKFDKQLEYTIQGDKLKRAIPLRETSMSKEERNRFLDDLKDYKPQAMSEFFKQILNKMPDRSERSR